MSFPNTVSRPQTLNPNSTLSPKPLTAGQELERKVDDLEAGSFGAGM